MKYIYYLVLMLAIMTPAHANELDFSIGMDAVMDEVRSCTGDCNFILLGGPSVDGQLRQTWGGVGYYLDGGGGLGGVGYGLALKKRFSFGDLGLLLGQRDNLVFISYSGATSIPASDVHGVSNHVGLFYSYPFSDLQLIEFRYSITQFDRTINSQEVTGTVGGNPVYTPRSATLNLIRQYLFLGYVARF